MMQLAELEKLDIGALAGPVPFEIVSYASIALLFVALAYIIRSYRKTKAKLLLLLLLWCVLFLVHEVLELFNISYGLQGVTGKLRISNNAVELFTIALILYLISR